MKFQVNAVIIVLLLSITVFASPVFGQLQGLDYDIRGGKVLGFEMDQENTALKILLESRTRGEITITIPRSLLDSTMNSEDTEFNILVNGLNLNFYEETKTEKERTVTIPFSRSDNEITIMGTDLLSQRSAPSQQQTIENSINNELKSEMPQNQAKLLIYSDTQWSGALQSSSFDFTEIEGQFNDEIIFSCESSFAREGVFGVKVQKMTQEGYLKLVVIQDQQIVSESSTEEPFGDILINGNCVSSFESDNIGEGGGGCLIATATYDSEMAPQVQQLRELRDNKILATESGMQFMTLFNDFYYSFSPYIADYERQNPTFKEVVKITITPMISSLSILNNVDINSEYDVLKYGISLILLNAGMYIGIPAIVIIGIKKKL